MVEVGLVGAGRVGLPVARRLSAAGYGVRVFEVRPEVEAQVRAFGGRWGGPVDEVDVLVTVLPGSPELRAVMLGGMLAELRADSAWVDLTSASPELGRELADAARAVGVDYLEAPLGGGPEAAESGTLTVYAGGERATFDRVRPVLEVFAERIKYVGLHGSGYLAKLLINLLWFNQAVAVGEVLRLGRSGGLDPHKLHEVLTDSPADSVFVRDVVPAYLAGDLLATFGMERIVEEWESIEQFARASDVPAAITGSTAALYREALEHFGPIAGELLGMKYTGGER
ncbi:NAD(P)-dependent oxidoreductase [Kribbella sp. NPDC056345]|uniref:NAD(P)-dependent oxidoreductase n=1 Tax=Kribbella sp. NPDC056345 TaxID=3345789 RepID=UPI0035E02889